MTPRVFALFAFLLLCMPFQADATSLRKLPVEKHIETIYRLPEVRSNLDYKTLQMAVSGYMRLRDNGVLGNNDVLTIIDYNKPSVRKRMFVIDVNNNRLLASSLVAHGKNSGQNMAMSFSNIPGSFKSSLGFFVTGQTYQGKHGYSLRLKGIERGINSNAETRNIVIHGADYVSEAFIKRHGRLGRSLGCPALPMGSSHRVIDLIKGGSCLFIYNGDDSYVYDSRLVKPDFAMQSGGGASRRS
ncbi:MAG: murein L,D-transpeptidase catalytic domain family protein [Prosthecochloris sp.]|uniref:murein L,D-transpeptidase catalytic domain family protein n=1 Tax=Prosthecochloris sp. TaxID=290513 RepID=UPI002582E563|nr:murein L,D-transpeptidase catalytic domain family protein [Prosthecochloris sp.]MCW8797421.1 murein L,D-transpeptidase catalytic domain family protein [Prosthecochloris sp.]